MERTAQNPDEDPQNTKNNPKTKTKKIITPKLKNYRGAVVAWKSTGHGRASRFIRLRYVGFPEETHLRCELASTENLVRLPLKSCSAPREE